VTDASTLPAWITTQRGLVDEALERFVPATRQPAIV
jgi:hypothetical protein